MSASPIFARLRRCEPPPNATEFSAIINVVSATLGVTVEAMMAKDRHKSVAFARHCAMYEVRERLKWSYPEIAIAFAKGDHTTVIAACKKIHALLVACDDRTLDVRIAVDRTMSKPLHERALLRADALRAKVLGP